VTLDPRSSKWLEEAALHYRSLVHPDAGKRNPASTRGGPDDPEMRDRASRQLDGAGGVSIALAHCLDRFDRRSASGIAYLAFLATMPLTGVAVPLPDTVRRR
jgi:hypothetical protein